MKLSRFRSFQIRFSVSWIKRHEDDLYVQKSIRSGLRARSAFKLIELQEKYRLISPNDFVIDLGAAPGGYEILLLFAIF